MNLFHYKSGRPFARVPLIVWVLGNLIEGCFLLQTSASPAPAVITSYGWRFEAEAFSPNSDHRLVDDASASGGAAISSQSAWQPLVQVGTLPRDVPETFEIWTRRRGGAVCLKTGNPDGKQRELGWTWGAPTRWSWQKAGTFSRVDLLGGLLFIRDGDASHEVALDAIAIVTNAVLAATAFAPPPLNVSVQVDWDAAASHPITARHWAINDYEIVKASEASAEFDGLLRELNPAIVRIHHASLVDTWSDAKKRTWDVAKIREAFERMPAYEGRPIMVCINGWPKWFYDGAVLPEDLYAPFAELCADLVRIFRDDLHRPVAYWEILNEQDNQYEKADALPSLWTLLASVMGAMRKVEPNVKLGGPALTWPKAEWVNGFLAECGSRIDFLSWHNYASGSRDESTESILTDKVDAIRGMANGAREILAKHQPERRIETFLTEYNISWSWETRDPRMVNHVGAIFQALVAMNMAEAGLDGAFVWHLKDNIYGLADSQNTRRPSYQLFCWGTQFLVGDMLPSTSSDAFALQVLAVRRLDGSRSLLLINRSDAALILPAPRTLLGRKEPMLEAHIEAETCTPLQPLRQPEVSLCMPPLSLRLVTDSMGVVK